MHTDETQRFTSFAGAYNAGRPGYPPEVIAAVFAGMPDPKTLVVADLGAGTGTSANLLAAAGAKVLAIEPNDAMRAKAQQAPGVTWSAGKAEETGLDDHSVDLVTAFQAFHWFNPPEFFVEMQRILRPGGRAVAVFYERDESDAFTKSYGDLIRRFKTDETEARRFKALENFETWSGWKDVKRSVFPGSQLMDPAGLRDRIKSTSYVPQSGPLNAELVSEAAALFSRYAKDGKISMRIQTIVIAASP